MVTNGPFRKGSWPGPSLRAPFRPLCQHCLVQAPRPSSGVGTVNEWISRDESCHADFACMLLRSSTDLSRRRYTPSSRGRRDRGRVRRDLPARVPDRHRRQGDEAVRSLLRQPLLKATNYPEMFENAKSPWKFINLLSVTGMTSFREEGGRLREEHRTSRRSPSSHL